MENWDDALEHFGSSLALLERIEDKRGLARTYDDRGLLYKDRGLSYKRKKDLYKQKNDLQKAENDFQHALKILDDIGDEGDEHEKAAAFSSLGNIFIRIADCCTGTQTTCKKLRITSS